jgi:hypothetical protein
MRFALTVFTLVLGLGAAEVRAQVQTDAQQRCIVAVNKAIGAVARAQAKTAAGCLKRASLDLNPAALETCLTADGAGWCRRPGPSSRASSHRNAGSPLISA